MSNLTNSKNVNDFVNTVFSMSRFNALTVFFIISTFLEHANGKAHSFYCEFGLCEPEQYCCGDNKCCDKLLDLWYFWVGLVLVIVVVAVIIFLKFYLTRKRTPNNRFKYHVLQQT